MTNQSKIQWSQKMLFLRGLMASADEVRKKHDDLYETHRKTHSNGWERQYDTFDFRGRMVTPGGNDNGMEENEMLWTTGEALKSREVSPTSPNFENSVEAFLCRD